MLLRAILHSYVGSKRCNLEFVSRVPRSRFKIVPVRVGVRADHYELYRKVADQLGVGSISALFRAAVFDYQLRHPVAVSPG